MKNNPLRVLIVGQGLAGTVLAATLEGFGCDVFVLDEGHEKAASSVAAGIINPITGKRFVKSWMWEEMLPTAEVFYRKTGERLGREIWRPREIVRILPTVKEANDWSARASLPDYSSYLFERNDGGDWSRILRPGFLFGGLRRAAQIDLPALLGGFRQVLTEKGRLFDEKLDFDRISTSTDAVGYGQEKFSKIIFCDGWRGSQNPFFRDSDCWNLAKGEALTVRIPGFSTDLLLKKTLMLAPLGGDEFWAGATTEWDFTDGRPTEKGRAEILEELEKTLAVPFEVTGHRSSIRPTMFDKRPVMGFLPEKPAIGIFNGMGAKGCSLAPFWAEKFARHLVFGEKLAAEVDFGRNFNRAARPTGDF